MYINKAYLVRLLCFKRNTIYVGGRKKKLQNVSYFIDIKRGSLYCYWVGYIYRVPRGTAWGRGAHNKLHNTNYNMNLYYLTIQTKSQAKNTHTKEML